MNTLKIFAIILGLASILSQSCQESFLELKEPVNPVLETYYTDSATAFNGLVGCYNSLTMVPNPEGKMILFFLLDTRSDDTDYAGNPRGAVEEQNYDRAAGFANFDIYSDNRWANHLWRYCYMGINTVNKYIEGLEAVDFPISQQPLIDQFKAEVLFMRAYYYFHLVKNFGPVVLYTNSLSEDEWYNQRRQEESLVYEQIFTDLREAIPLLPLKSAYGDGNYGRITKAAAQTLLAKALITEAELDGSSPNWQEAYDLCKSVEESGEYDLNTLFTEMFTVAGQFSSGFIFDILSEESINSENDSYIHYVSPRYIFIDGVPDHSRKMEFGFGLAGITEELANQFGYHHDDDSLTFVNLNDSRGKFTFRTRWDKYDGYTVVDNLTGYEETRNPHNTDDANYYQRKYNRETISSQYHKAGANYHVIRYAETLLLGAEAAYYLNNDDEAKRLVNLVRERAFRPAIQEGRVTLGDIRINSSGNDLLEDIWQERRLELAGENDRFYDLKRTHRLHILKEKKPDIFFQEGKHELLPIPVSELAMAPNLTQNPGY